MEQRRHSTNFNLQRMERIFDQANGKTDVPHRHDYYTVLFVRRAEGKHIIDYQTHAFGINQVHFVSPGQVHQVHTPVRPEGWVITFSREFLINNNIPERFISNINLFRQFGETPPLHIEQETSDKLVHVIEEMEQVFTADLHYGNRALGSLLQLFLIWCNNSCNFNEVQLDEESNGVCLLRSFKALIEEHYTEWHKVAEYASRIPITSKHLSETVKSLTGKTAKEHIQDRLVLEAKRLLLHSQLSVKEIAYRLGFIEPLHFSSFFKKAVGLAPSHFRAK